MFGTVLNETFFRCKHWNWPIYGWTLCEERCKSCNHWTQCRITRGKKLNISKWINFANWEKCFRNSLLKKIFSNEFVFLPHWKFFHHEMRPHAIFRFTIIFFCLVNKNMKIQSYFFVFHRYVLNLLKAPGRGWKIVAPAKIETPGRKWWIKSKPVSFDNQKSNSFPYLAQN